MRFDDCCLLFRVRGLMVVVWCVLCRRLLFVDRYLLIVVCWLLIVVCFLVFIVRCLLFVEYVLLLLV